MQNKLFNLFKKFSFKKKGLFRFNATNKLTDPELQWNKTDFLNANQISLVTNKCVSKRASKVGQIEFILTQGDKPVLNNPALDVLNNPNPFFSKTQFWTLYQQYKDLTGTAYIWVVQDSELFGPKKIAQLVLLRPDLVKFELGSEGEIGKFIYQSPNGKSVNIDPQFMIYSRNPDPKSPLNGLSILSAGVRAIDTENQIANYHSKILRNGGKVEGIFKFKSNLTKEQVQQNKDLYKQQVAGAKKSGVPLFLGGDVDYTRTGLTPDELSFMEAKKSTMEDILILTGVPKSMLGLTSDETFANAEAGIRVFLRETITPLMDELVDELNMRFFDDQGMTLGHVDIVPEDQENKRANLETANNIHAMTTNEKREQLDLKPIKGGDEVLVPFNLSPVGEENSKPKEDEKKSLKKKEFDHPLRDYDARQAYGKMMIKRMDANEKRFIKVLDKYFKEQKLRMIEGLEAQDFKMFTKDIIDETFDKVLELKIAKETFLPVMEQILIEAGIDSKEISGSTFEFNITSDIQSWLDKKVDIFSEINETTFKKLKKDFSQSLADGETRPQLISRIENTFGNISKNRAATIARTEILGVTQKGTFEGYQQANLQIKIWVTVGDGNVRDSHAMQDGEERPINDTFTNGLMFPGDPSGPASEVVNCRCSI